MAAESIAARVAWYGVFAGPVSGKKPRDGRGRLRRVIDTAADEPAAAGGQARLTAALQERDLGSLAGARHLPPETVAHLWHEALAPFLEDEGLRRDRVRALRAGRRADPAPARGARRS